MSTTLFDSPPDKMERNPMVLRYGRTEGEKCKTCRHLTSHKHDRRWYKCMIRGITSGPGTDHGCTWTACGLWEEAE